MESKVLSSISLSIFLVWIKRTKALRQIFLLAVQILASNSKKASSESDKVSIYLIIPNHLIFTLKRKPLQFLNGGPKAYSLRQQITRYIKSKILIEVKRNGVKEADEGWSSFEFGNPQPSGPRWSLLCVNNLFSRTLGSFPCGMLCLCACAFKLVDFLSLDLIFHRV